MEFDISKVVEEITMQAKENQEEFIFETIQPYCENILQMKINKEELKQILLNGMQKQQPCEDCISREEVINELKLGYFNNDLQEGKNDPCVIDAMIDWAIRTIKRQPSVTPSYNSIKSELKPSEDCISREEVIKHLENITMDTNPDNYDNKDKWYQANGFNLCKVGIEMYVKNLPSVTPKTRWIPVSERLPEEADVYLVSMNRLGYPQREVDGFVCGRWERFGNDVIAWCKIPEPYKEESEE